MTRGAPINRAAGSEDDAGDPLSQAWLELTVTDRGRPVARLVPMADPTFTTMMSIAEALGLRIEISEQTSVEQMIATS